MVTVGRSVVHLDRGAGWRIAEALAVGSLAPAMPTVRKERMQLALFEGEIMVDAAVRFRLNLISR